MSKHMSMIFEKMKGLIWQAKLSSVGFAVLGVIIPAICLEVLAALFSRIPNTLIELVIFGILVLWTCWMWGAYRVYLFHYHFRTSVKIFRAIREGMPIVPHVLIMLGVFAGIIFGLGQGAGSVIRAFSALGIKYPINMGILYCLYFVTIGSSLGIISIYISSICVHKIFPKQHGIVTRVGKQMGYSTLTGMLWLFVLVVVNWPIFRFQHINPGLEIGGVQMETVYYTIKVLVAAASFVISGHYDVAVYGVLLAENKDSHTAGLDSNC